MSSNPFEVKIYVPGRTPVQLVLDAGSRVSDLKRYLQDDASNSDLASKTFQRSGEVLSDTTALAEGDILTTKTNAEGGIL